MTSVAVFGLRIDSSFMPDLNRLFALLHERGIPIYIYKPFYDSIEDRCSCNSGIAGFFTFGYELPESVEFLFSIGGDGTLLKSMLTLKNKSIPVIGFNTGRLGFLSAISREDMAEAIEMIFAGQYEIEERSVLQFEEGTDLFGDFNYALNEVTVTKMDNSSMISIHTFLDDEYLTTYWADGLIISTPTGSTAYSLSVGGPILPPNSNSFVITPIAPHNLTMRPIVVPDNCRIRLSVEGRGQQFLCSLDSRSQAINFPGTVEIRKANFQVKTLKLPGYGFFSTLRNKLMWGTDRRN
ncbi:NAD kinase [Mangrovibacterium marinum]|uniref:NAD kinase n=1 Tax=Mangrovibacterium marinum TaxID=1639118 RepID=A0A2T5C3X6_9BACT|nr:NAD kinase [Mangrovibacterium marinum]PTN09511.1 NAD+ kinase [Mangrovibacterium marinum]